MSSIRVLFVCFDNASLSPMAEGFLRRYGGAAFDVSSAGIAAGNPDPLTVDVMQRGGVDISTHAPRGLDEVDGEPFDFVITVGDRARDAVHAYPGAHRLIHWRFDEPGLASGSPIERRKAYVRTRDEVAGRVRLFAYAQTRRGAHRRVTVLPAAEALPTA